MALVALLMPAACASPSTVTFRGTGTQRPTAPFTLDGSVDARWAIEAPADVFCDFDAIVWAVRADPTMQSPPVGDPSRPSYVLAAVSDDSGSRDGERVLGDISYGLYVVFVGGSDGCGSWAVTLTTGIRDGAAQ